LHDKEDK